MFDFLSSGLGIGSAGLVVLIIFMLYMKLMKWVFKIAIFGIVLLGAYWYLQPATGG